MGFSCCANHSWRESYALGSLMPSHGYWEGVIYTFSWQTAHIRFHKLLHAAFSQHQDVVSRQISRIVLYAFENRSPNSSSIYAIFGGASFPSSSITQQRAMYLALLKEAKYFQIPRLVFLSWVQNWLYLSSCSFFVEWKRTMPLGLLMYICQAIGTKLFSLIDFSYWHIHSHSLTDSLVIAVHRNLLAIRWLCYQLLLWILN